MKTILSLAILSTAVMQGAITNSTITARNSGFYNNDGTFNSLNGYAAGSCKACYPTGELRSFFVFDLSGVTAKITAAKIRLQNSASGFLSPQTTETFTLYDVATPVTTLTLLTGGVQAFNDLGGGVALGTITMTAANNNQIVEINLNAQGIAYLNATKGNVALGGALTTIDGNGNEYVFNSTNSSMVRELVITTDSSLTPCTFTLSQASISVPADGNTSSVSLVNTAGASCFWEALNNTSWITVTPSSGTGSATLSIIALANPSTSQRSATLTVAGITLTVTQSPNAAPLQGTPLRFVSLTPCRLVETRQAYNFQGRTGPFGPPALSAGETRTFTPSASNVCQVPSSARAFVLNVTVLPTKGVDYVTVYPYGENRPQFYTVASPDGEIVANSAFVRAGVGGAISVYTSQATDVLVDIAGYFTDNPAVSNLTYYPLTPCRVIETRSAYRPQTGQFGPPSMQAKQTRSFRFPQSTDCTIPQGAAAYSITVTVVPPASLPYLTAWPAGGAQPNVSTINSPSGRVLANSVIIPASNDGSISLYAFENTDVVVDINGYFAPDNGSGLYFYPVTQCRLSNTQDSGFNGSFGPPSYSNASSRTIPVTASVCSDVVPSAKAYALNAVVKPNGSPMPFLTVWPTGQTQPNASVLNAFQGQTLSGAFIVPAGTNGSVDVFAFRATNLMLEISGYFGR